MRAASIVRLERARGRVSEEDLEEQLAAAAPPPPLRLSAAGFDIIAELKLRSPSAGALAAADTAIGERVRAYARGGAAAVSVLTEPEHFGGCLGHLEEAVAALADTGVPVMRKDFLVHPYQVMEARARGAGGVLVILRMLTDDEAETLIDAALARGMFVLLEAFDIAELDRAGSILRNYPGREAGLPVGLNCRDLRSLGIDPARLDRAAGRFPAAALAVAESGLESPADAERLAGLGYRLALVGTALMGSADPAALLARLLAAGRGGCAA